MSDTAAGKVSPIRYVTQGVADLDRTVQFYADAFDFTIKGLGTVPADTPLAAAWRLAPGMSASYVVTGPRNPAAPLLRLLQVSEPGERIWGTYERRQDSGHFAVNYRVPVLESGYRRLLDAGAEVRTTPMFWELEEGMSAWESQVIDPDGTLLDVFEMQGERVPELFGPIDEACSGVQTMAIHTNDGDRAKAFYTALGFEELYDHVYPGLEDLIHLPKGSKLRNVNLWQPGQSRIGRIEVAQYVGFPGESNRDRAAPPNTGPISIAFETADLAATRTLLAELGVEEIGGPVEANIPPVGQVMLVTAFGPDGEMLEFFQRG